MSFAFLNICILYINEHSASMAGRIRRPGPRWLIPAYGAVCVHACMHLGASGPPWRGRTRRLWYRWVFIFTLKSNVKCHDLWRCDAIPRARSTWNRDQRLAGGCVTFYCCGSVTKRQRFLLQIRMSMWRGGAYWNAQICLLALGLDCNRLPVFLPCRFASSRRFYYLIGKPNDSKDDIFQRISSTPHWCQLIVKNFSENHVFRRQTGI